MSFRPGRAVRRPASTSAHSSVLSIASASVVALGLLACGGDDPSEPTPDPVAPAFPADYETSYTMVRDCRETSDHGLGVQVQVWADPTSAQKYVDGDYPLDEGSVLVKPLYAGDDCETGALLGYVVMVKGGPGTAPNTNDWLWQEVDADRNVTRNGDLTSCTGCHRTCADRDYTCTDE